MQKKNRAGCSAQDAAKKGTLSTIKFHLSKKIQHRLKFNLNDQVILVKNDLITRGCNSRGRQYFG